METQKICPNCRKPLPPDVPLGLCPECLIKSGFPTEGGGRGSGEAAGSRFVPPPVEEIAQLFPQFEILGFIGKGGMGAVYKARQPALDRFVALKVLPPAVASDPGFAERFNREARALARLNHPNIVSVHDFGKAGPLHYLLMEFVDGTNLREVEHAGRLSPEQALAIVPQICEALQFAHNEGIVHRDIKPENLLLDKKGRVKITDFGIAKIVGVPAGKVSLTGVKDVVGTPHYMAPEQIEKPQTVDHRADIYSLGVVFYEMLTGELPLGKFAPPSKKVQIDVRLDEVVLHTLEKEPARRYQQVNQLKTDVETIAGTVSTGAGFAAQGGVVPPSAIPSGKATSDKVILPAFLLALPFGVFGAHRFYVGKIWTGIAQLGALGGCILMIIACATRGAHWQPTLGILLEVSIVGCGIWATIDWILILCKAFTDGQGRRITNWFHPQNGDLKNRASSMAVPPSTPPVRTGQWPWILAAVALTITALIVVGWLTHKAGGRKAELTTGGNMTNVVTGNGPVTNRGATPELNLSSQNGHIVIETTNGRLLADKIQLKADTNGTVTLTGGKIEYEPANASQPTNIPSAATSQTISHQEKTIGHLSTTDPFHQDFNQTLPLSAHGRFRIDNVNGRIEIFGWDGNDVVIKALKHGKTQESVEAAKITVDSSPDEIAIHTEPPSSATGFSGIWSWLRNGGNNNAVVDYAIQVPRHVRLANVSSVNGRIVIEDVSGDIEASTVNGAMQVEGAAGDMKLSTVNGRIAAELISLGRGQSVSIESVNGKIEVTLPANADAEVSASTVNGGMTSEFPALVVQKEFPVSKKLKGTLGNGSASASVKASTVNGGISFRRGTGAK